MQLNMFTDWLKRRRITDEVIALFGLHVGTHGSFGECLVIPVHGENKAVLFNKYRRNPTDQRKPKYIHDAGSAAALYGLPFLDASSSVLITEGEMDTLVAWSHNIPAVSGTTGALTFKQEWAELLKDRQVVLCFDNDDSGGKGMARTLKLIPHARVLFLPDQPNIKDISDYVAHGGNLHDLLQTARHFISEEEVIADRAARISLFKSTFFHDAWIEANKPEPVYPRREVASGDEVERARAYPVPNLMKLNRGKACCPWHNERTPSLHYYARTNTVYCFGCGKFGDAIDVYRAIHGCSFKEALKALS